MVSHPPVSLCGSAREASTRQEVMSSHSLKTSPLFAQCYCTSPKNWMCSSSEKQTVRQPPSTRISTFVRAKFMLFSVTFNNTTPSTETSQFDRLRIPTCLMMTLYSVACPTCQQIAILSTHGSACSSTDNVGEPDFECDELAQEINSFVPSLTPLPSEQDAISSALHLSRLTPSNAGPLPWPLTGPALFEYTMHNLFTMAFSTLFPVKPAAGCRATSDFSCDLIS